MFKRMAFLVSLFSFISSSQAADLTSSDMYKVEDLLKCEDNLGDYIDTDLFYQRSWAQQYCEGYVVASIKMYIGLQQEESIICLPNNSISINQIISIVVKEVRNSPEKWHQFYPMYFVIAALSKYFPCNS